MKAMIRPATVHDAAILADLHRQCFDPGWIRESFAELLSDGATFGFLGRTGSAAFDAFVLARAVAGEGEILSLATLPAARRQGLARLLLNAAVGEIGRRGGRALFLEVAEHNRAALRLYESTGFVRVGARPAYYSTSTAPPAGALILRREIAAPE